MKHTFTTSTRLGSFVSSMKNQPLTFELLSQAAPLPDLVVFSHLRWEFVYQRPQHILTRLSNNRKILVIEEPIGYEDESELGTYKSFSPSENITVIQPRIKSLNQVSLLSDIIMKAMKKSGIKQYMTWFYSAIFIDVLPFLKPIMTIYDCMDELSAFDGAPAELIEQEKKLIKLADIIFTGGKSLYESKSKLAKNVYCYPSSVEIEHFKHSLSSQKPADIKKLHGPLVGFYGVLDERLDPILIGNVANQMKDVTFLLIGPIVKIDPASLPKSDNIVYLGKKNYEQLPQYLKYIDVAMMPFAINKATRFISPTKTLEFMAAEKPIISTPIVDVVRDYKGVVEIASSADEFVAKLQGLLSENSKQRSSRIEAGKRIVKATSWDKTVQDMEANMRQILTLKWQYRDKSESVFSPTFSALSLEQIYETP